MFFLEFYTGIGAGKLSNEKAGLPEGWLNDSVKGFVTDAAPSEDFLTLPNLKITTVSADYLLAMKLVSARYGETAPLFVLA